MHKHTSPSAQDMASGPNALFGLIEWLCSDECHELDEAGLALGLGQRLCEIGLPVDRMTLHLMTLHPEIVGRSIAWAPNEPVHIRDREHANITPTFIGSALWRAMSTRETVVARHNDPKDRWQELDTFTGRDLVELIVVPLCNADGPVSAASFGTRRPRGFTPSEQNVIERIIPSLRNVCELRTLRQTELSLLYTYVGPMTAQRILAGRIRKNEIETIDAALMLCDLRGFTELSNRLPASRVLELLNIYFDVVVPAITHEGGEILKFMGDAVLAVFPGYNAARCSRSALTAAISILEKLERMAFTDAKLQAGIALHYGEASYGNIGSGRRLDFTVIGPDINLLSRIQGVCGEAGYPLLMSARLGEIVCDIPTTSIGTFALKGFKDLKELFIMP